MLPQGITWYLHDDHFSTGPKPKLDHDRVLNSPCQQIHSLELDANDNTYMSTIGILPISLSLVVVPDTQTLFHSLTNQLPAEVIRNTVVTITRLCLIDIPRFCRVIAHL